ncbi:MAG: hypothetical protein JNL66_02480 [Alphaproteobacteria bacterium]|nr:hypothetical protein [Alphaproteobacteria bacterium]
MTTAPAPTLPRFVVGFFVLLIGFWSLLCLGLYAAVGFSSEMMRAVVSWFGAVPGLDWLVAVLAAAGGTIVFLAWFFGTAVLAFLAWMLHRAGSGTVYVYSTRTHAEGAYREGPSWDRPMKDVTPPRDGPPDDTGASRRDPPPLIAGR